MEEIKKMEEGLKVTFVQIPHKTSSGTANTNLFSLAKTQYTFLSKFSMR